MNWVLPHKNNIHRWKTEKLGTKSNLKEWKQIIKYREQLHAFLDEIKKMIQRFESNKEMEFSNND